MCQWKFFVFWYSANTSARIAFIAPAMSLVAVRVSSVGVFNGALRLCRRSAVLIEFGSFMFSLAVQFMVSAGTRWPLFAGSVFISDGEVWHGSKYLARPR